MKIKRALKKEKIDIIKLGCNSIVKNEGK